jgi:hypothetical protein
MQSMKCRAVSRAWHRFLGFRVYLSARKRPLTEDQSIGNAQKRIRTEWLIRYHNKCNSEEFTELNVRTARKQDTQS